MRVNLGCGDRYAHGWVNVDHAGMPHHKDITLDLRAELPWDNGELNRIYAGHLLEHLRVHECIDVLERLRDCTATGGQLLVVGPDVDKARGMALAGTLDVTLESLQYGAGRWCGDEHRWECSPPAIRKLLRVAGWWHVESLIWDDIPKEWPIAERGPRWQCAVLASP
jgi:hypothetical protein